MTCHNCRIDAPKHGKHRNGLQRYRCSQCAKTFTEAHEERFQMEDHLKTERGLLAVRLLVEGNSIRTAARITGLHHRTVVQLAVIAGQRCEALLSAKVRNVPVTDVQCDEIWTFVGKKRGHRRGNEENFSEIGDAWIFVGIERNTKLVLAFELGGRGVKSATRFMHKVARATDPSQKFQLTTDGLQAYSTAIGNVLGHQGERVDYAQLVKIYKLDIPEDQRRYSPPRLAEAIPTPIYGNPEEALICTRHVERQNLTMRMCMRRLTRLTNAFSKKWDNLRAATALHFAYYNFCKVHGTIRRTPAMASGLTDHAWDLSELFA